MINIRVIEGELILRQDGVAVAGAGCRFSIGDGTGVFHENISASHPTLKRSMVYDAATNKKLSERYSIGGIGDAWLEYAGVTRQQMSNGIGLNRSDINKKFNGLARISRLLLDRICAFHGVTIEEYLGGPPKKEAPVGSANAVAPPAAPSTPQPPCSFPPTKTSVSDDCAVGGDTSVPSPTISPREKRPSRRGLGPIIKLWLQRQDPPMRQGELAKLIHVTDSSVSRMISGVDAVTADVLDRIVHAVGAGSVDNFMSIDQ